MNTSPSLRSSGWVEIKGECPCCGHAGGWCTRTCDGKVIKCRRAESKHPVKQKDGTTAWLHPAIPGEAVRHAPAAKVGGGGGGNGDKPKRTARQWLEFTVERQLAVEPTKLKAFAGTLGVSHESLIFYGVGRDESRKGWTFPMYDGTAHVCGVHVRADDGTKRCVKGSSLGLYLPYADDGPAPNTVKGNPLVLVTPEGPTDCAAAFDAGFRAVGRPSNAAGGRQLRTLLSAGEPQHVAIVADRDATKYLPDGTPFWPGIEGALYVCGQILPACRTLRFCLPPDNAKDLRAWLKAGGTKSALEESLRAAPLVSVAWLAKAEDRLKQRKLNERREPAAEGTA